MRRREVLILVVLIVALGAAAFYAGRTRAAGRNTAGPGWLRDVPASTVEEEVYFAQQARLLSETVCAERAAFSSMLADANATEDQIRVQMDRVLESHGTLVRAVGQRLVGLRERLPELQARGFMQSCADSLRGQVQRRYRWRGGAQDDSGLQAHTGGRGAGYGRQYRGGRDGGLHLFARRLQLTEEQNAWMEAHDPNFEADCVLLKERLRQVHTDLIASLEDSDSVDQELLAQIDTLVEAHRELETRVAQSIMLLRPHLSPEQRTHLSGLCRGRLGPRSGGPISSRCVDLPGLLAQLSLLPAESH